MRPEKYQWLRHCDFLSILPNSLLTSCIYQFSLPVSFILFSLVASLSYSMHPHLQIPPGLKHSSRYTLHPKTSSQACSSNDSTTALEKKRSRQGGVLTNLNSKSEPLAITMDRQDSKETNMEGVSCGSSKTSSIISAICGLVRGFISSPNKLRRGKKKVYPLGQYQGLCAAIRAIRDLCDLALGRVY